jgi:toxin YoeB
VRVVFTPDGWCDYVYWIENDAKILAMVTRLIEDARRAPFIGLGVYRVEGRGDDQYISIAQCRHHY